MSHHTLLDIASEIQKTKKHKVMYILRWDMVLLFITYVLVGVIPYFYFGNKIVTFNYGNILLSYEFRRVPMIICNGMLAIFVFVNNILKFKPAKDVLTCILRESYRESDIWNFCIISLLHLAQTVASCLMVRVKVQLNTACAIISIFTLPLLYLIFPFIAYHMTFFYNEKKDLRRKFYLLLMFIGIFINVSAIGYILMIFFISER